MAKKIKDEAIEQKAITTMQIAAEVRAVVERIIEAGGECDDATMTALKEWQAALETKAQNVAHITERMAADIAYFKAIEDKARSRRKAIEAADARLREYLAACMTEAQVKSIKGEGLFSISLIDGRPSVSVEDASRLEIGRFAEIVETLKPKTDAIKEALLNGEKVDGAALEYGRSYVQIR